MNSLLFSPLIHESGPIEYASFDLNRSSIYQLLEASRSVTDTCRLPRSLRTDWSGKGWREEAVQKTLDDGHGKIFQPFPSFLHVLC